MIWLLIYTFLIFIINLKGYKDYFKTKNQLIKKLEDQRKELDSNTDTKPYHGIAMTIFATFYLLFHGIFYYLVYKYSNNTVMTVLSAFFMVNLITSIKPLYNAWSHKKYSINWTRFIIKPITTIYIIMFVYFLFN